MHRLRLFMILVALLCSGATLAGSAQDQLTVDATKQLSPPPPGRGPFPGSATPGHSAGLPIRLELLVPIGELQSNGTALVDFIITNIGVEPIILPFSIQSGQLLPKPPDAKYKLDVLTLWILSDAIGDRYARDVETGRPFKVEIVETSAHLYGRSDNPNSFCLLAPSQSIRVHATSPQLKSGTYSFTAHAQLVRVTVDSADYDTVNETSEGLGTADSDVVVKALSVLGPNLR